MDKRQLRTEVIELREEVEDLVTILVKIQTHLDFALEQGLDLTDDPSWKERAVSIRHRIAHIHFLAVTLDE